MKYLASLVLTIFIQQAAVGECNKSLIKYADLLVKHGFYEEGVKIYFEILNGDCRSEAIVKKIEQILNNGTYSFSDSINVMRIKHEMDSKNYTQAMEYAIELIKETTSSRHRLQAHKLAESLTKLIKKENRVKDSINFLIGDSYMKDDNFDKAIEYYEKFESPDNRVMAEIKISRALDSKGFWNDFWNDVFSFIRLIFLVIIVISVLIILCVFLRQFYRFKNRKRIEIIAHSDGFESYVDRFRFLFMVKNEEFYESIETSAIMPSITLEPPSEQLQDRALNRPRLHDDSVAKEFFDALDGFQYVAIVRWLVFTIYKADYQLQYSFKMTADANSVSQVAFSAILTKNRKMLKTITKSFPENSIIVQEQALAHELVAIVYQAINE